MKIATDNMNKKFLAIVLLCFLCSCRENTPFYYPSEKESLSNEITNKVAIQLERERGLSPFGSGGRAMEEIKMLALVFKYYHDTDIEEGRELLIASVDAFTSAINADKRIHPYLVNYPFTPKNIQIRILLQTPDGSEPEYGKLSVISAMDGKLIYKTEEKDAKWFKIIHQETYAEALEAVKKSQPSLTQN